MQFIVNRQIAIDTETPEEALEKTKPVEGSSISFSVNPRPQSPPQSQVKMVLPSVPTNMRTGQPV
jgi:hypothetical protein